MIRAYRLLAHWVHHHRGWVGFGSLAIMFGGLVACAGVCG